MQPREVLDFWFGSKGQLQSARDLWFRKSAATDSEIRDRFGASIELALGGALDSWRRDLQGRRALILLLDQFTRNVYRDTPRAFAGDPAALALARAMVAGGEDRSCDPYERWFIYLPFEHSESLADQDDSVRLFRALADDGLPSALDWAERHREVIRRFGRFPHRNAILGRVSSAEELEFLRQPGSSF
jgi:uncharacterized protein (DUF924 family)